jgi:hypothetical protein
MMRVHGAPDSELITATTVTAGSAGVHDRFAGDDLGGDADLGF